MSEAPMSLEQGVGAAPGPEPPWTAEPYVPRRPSARERIQLGGQLWLVCVLAVVIIVFSLRSSSFLSQANWLNTALTATEVLLLAVGQTFVIITGGIDLSDGAVLGLSGMVGGWVMSQLGGGTTGDAALVTAVGFAVALAIGLLVGLVNGTLIARYRIPAFVVTLGTLGICTGVADLVYNGQEISNLPAAVGTIGSTNVFGWVPVPAFVAAVLTIGTAALLRRTRFGEHTYALGDSRDAAVRAGIRDRSHLVRVYVLSSVLAAVSGILVMARLAVASPTSGSNDELNAIAAVVIGGASLFGGKGTILGSFLGTALISILLTGLIIVNVPPFWQLIAVGAVLIAAVYVDQLRERRAS